MTVGDVENHFFTVIDLGRRQIGSLVDGSFLARDIYVFHPDGRVMTTSYVTPAEQMFFMAFLASLDWTNPLD